MELNKNEIAIICEILGEQIVYLKYLLEEKGKEQIFIEEEIQKYEKIYFKLEKVECLDVSELTKHEKHKLCECLYIELEELKNVQCDDNREEIQMLNFKILGEL